MCLCVCVCVSLFKKASQLGDSGLILGVGQGVKTFVTYQEVVDFRCDQHITRKILTEQLQLQLQCVFSFVFVVLYKCI